MTTPEEKKKTRPLWCITKSVSIRKNPFPEDDNPVIGRVVFGKQVTAYGENLEVVNGRVKITLRDAANIEKKKPSVTGWALLRGFTSERVEDFAGLYHRNLTGKKIPSARNYRGTADRFISPGERVAVYAKVGEWALTSKGWTKHKWLTKDRDIDLESIPELYYAVLEQAVHDYKNCVTRIKKHKHHGPEEFCSLVWEINDITKFFVSPEYGLLNDSVPGQERLADLNEELMVDEKWLNDKRRMARELTAGRRKRKVL